MSYKDQKMLYIPDKNLGTYLADKYNLDIDVWPGFCCIHNNLTVEDVNTLKKQHPNALLLIHPESPLAVLKMADFVGSTKGILDFATASEHEEFIIGTEDGILHPLQKNNPNKKFYILSSGLRCYDMKLTKIEDVLYALQNETFEITVDPETLQGAKKALDKMMEMS